VPSWSKDLSFGSHLINARSETVTEKPTFRHAIKYRRCIIPTFGFYEWDHSGVKKQPYYIQLANHSPMCLAGLWESWKAPDGSELESFAILTTTANKLVESIHDRMPVILHPDTFSLWLSQNMHDPEQLQPLCIPFPAAERTAYNVPVLSITPVSTPLLVLLRFEPMTMFRLPGKLQLPDFQLHHLLTPPNHGGIPVPHL